MPDSNRNGGGEGADSQSPNLWVKAGVASALGFEFVGFVLAGVFIGVQIDARFDSSPVGLLVSLALAIFCASGHIYLVCRRVLMDDEA